VSGAHELNDPELLRLLGDVLNEADPVPSEVTDFALAMIRWPKLDTDVAPLVFDSLVEEPVAVRAQARTRMLTFESREFVVDLEYDRDGAFLVGTVLPRADYRVDLVRHHSEVTTRTDDRGRFEIGLSGSGPLSIVISRQSIQILRTEWVLLA
jgi:hypothetical protein